MHLVQYGCQIQPERLHVGGVSAREMSLLVDLMVPVFIRQYSLSIAWPFSSDLHSPCIENQIHFPYSIAI
jgi:hypothetical protein